MLDGEHPVQGDPGGPGHSPFGLDEEPGEGQPGGGAALGELRAQPPDEGGDMQITHLPGRGLGRFVWII
ncbi:hypothetical protein GCM10010497_23920 [Streptomyces cinereoruber]|uniref:Uncharacterized protein n=1 Tax=Streptomyces cinereoruber TaxID=67260 RepID=A0AAV4KG54_9ACTN|nr:hypothetical protein GCM10010497_23920 [Streptomyces cinereoruber]